MNRTRAGLAALIAGIVLVGGCGLGGGGADDGTAASVAQPLASEPENIVDPVEETDEPDPEPASPSPSPSKKPSKPTKAKKTAEPIWDEAPACATWDIDKDKQVSRSKVRKALKAAAGRTYWRSQAPELKLNYPLVKAVAWHESGWQSHIRNCDGGYGVMQVMPGTVDQMNQRFGLTYDAKKYQDNAYVGANYLAWLTRYFGKAYFKDKYDLRSSKCKSHTSTNCLLNLVISGYNAGPGTVDDAFENKTLPNPQYVDSVRSLMAKCPCDKY